MGRSTTPTHAVRMVVPGFAYSPAAWPTKHHGRPTDATLAEYVTEFEASCAPGGCNAHLGPQRVTRASVIRQSTGALVASYTAPAFTTL